MNARRARERRRASLPPSLAAAARAELAVAARRREETISEARDQRRRVEREAQKTFDRIRADAISRYDNEREAIILNATAQEASTA